jgi:hypothetical protein
MHNSFSKSVIESTAFGACFTSPSNEYSITLVNVNRSQEKVYKALRMIHRPSGQVIDDPWDQGKDMAGNAKLIQGLCTWCDWKLSSYVVSYVGTCPNCPDVRHEYSYDATSRLQQCKACKSTLVYEEMHSSSPPLN